MSVGSVLIGLQASCGSSGVTSEEFLVPLEIDPGEVESARADGGAWASGMVCFAVVRYSDYSNIDTSADAGAQSIAFENGIADGFRKAASFLSERQPQVTAQMRSAGLQLRLFVEIRMDQDQMELSFPPEFVAACAQHALTVYIISNDY